MKTYYITFAANHLWYGFDIHDFYITVEAKDVKRAIIKANNLFKDNWAEIYTEYNFEASFFPKGDLRQWFDINIPLC